MVLKRLMGIRAIEDAFQRLDSLTREEGLMAATRTLEVIHDIDGKVIIIKKVIGNVDRSVRRVHACTQCYRTFCFIY
jgi:hypothetical protein